MRRLLSILGIVVGVVVVLFGALALLSEMGEVVVLHTTDPEGGTYDARLWIVEDGGQEWLRAGSPQSRWYGYLRANLDVSLTRGETTRLYRAVPLEDPAARDRVNALMSQKYGLADRVIHSMADSSDAVPIRLDPR